MRNKIAGRRLGRTTAHREALFRNMITSLVTHERIRTTLAKAKELRRHAEKVVTWAKQGESQHHTMAHGFLRSPLAVTKLFKEIAPRYEERNGGYSRVLRAGFRRGDRAPMAILEFVDREGEMRPARRSKSVDAIIEKTKPNTNSSALAAEAEATVSNSVYNNLRGNYRRSSITISNSAPELTGKTLLERAKEAVERQVETINLLKAARVAASSVVNNSKGIKTVNEGKVRVEEKNSTLSISKGREEEKNSTLSISKQDNKQENISKDSVIDISTSRIASILQLQPAFPVPRPARSTWFDFEKKEKALQAHAAARKAARIAEGVLLQGNKSISSEQTVGSRVEQTKEQLQ
jgi:large subunit ribosomal protein L17